MEGGSQGERLSVGKLQTTADWRKLGWENAAARVLSSPAIVICCRKGLEETPRSEPPTSATQIASTITALRPMRHSVTRHADMPSLTYGLHLFVGSRILFLFLSFLSRLSLACNATTVIVGPKRVGRWQVDYIRVVCIVLSKLLQLVYREAQPINLIDEKVLRQG